MLFFKTYIGFEINFLKNKNQERSKMYKIKIKLN